MFGCITNFKEWSFTYFNMEDEATYAYQILDAPRETFNPFDVSKIFRIVDINGDIDPIEL